MLDPFSSSAPLDAAATKPRKPPAQKVFAMEKHDRMGGSVPVWSRSPGPAQQITARLAQAAAAPQTGNVSHALAYNNPEQFPRTAPQTREFGFSDLLDMANPLHHIPLIGTLYRNLSGDSIQPISRIIGGGIYGGGAGAAGGIVNMIAEYETGRDIPENLIHLARSGRSENI
jgi:hypothetical protein